MSMGDGEVTVGYKYFIGMHLVVCHGPVDEVLQIQVGDRVAWSGIVTSTRECRWEQIGTIGESVGLEWAGRWRKFREFPHFQFTDGLRLAEFQAGCEILKDN